MIETGWAYLALVMDLFDLKVIGWSYGVTMTEELVIDAFNKACPIEVYRKIESSIQIEEASIHPTSMKVC